MKHAYECGRYLPCACVGAMSYIVSTKSAVAALLGVNPNIMRILVILYYFISLNVLIYYKLCK